MDVDVVIPTWNRLDLLRGCLDHLAAQTIQHRVYVVDNASEDGTVAFVRQHYPAVEVVELAENLGFGVAINHGVAAGSGEVIVLLNNDVNVEPDFLAELVAPLENDPTVGMVAGVLLDARDGQIDAAGVEVDGGLGGYSFMHGHPVGSLTQSPTLIGPCGGAAAYRRAAFEAVGSFDEEIFAYSEDVDLALRLRAAGWGCQLAVGARGLHLGSASLGRRSVVQTRIAATSRGYILGRYRVGYAWLLTELTVALVDCLVLRSFAPLSGRIKGWRDGRRLPRRGLPDKIEMLSWRDAMRRRLAAAFN